MLASDDEKKCDSEREGDVAVESGNENEVERKRKRGRNAGRSSSMQK